MVLGRSIFGRSDFIIPELGHVLHIAQHLGRLTVYLGNETTTVVIPLVRSVFLARSEFLGRWNGALNVSGAGVAYIDEVVRCVT